MQQNVTEIKKNKSENRQIDILFCRLNEWVEMNQNRLVEFIAEPDVRTYNQTANRNIWKYEKDDD